jgi:hypothetical protein
MTPLKLLFGKTEPLVKKTNFFWRLYATQQQEPGAREANQTYCQKHTEGVKRVSPDMNAPHGNA